LRLSKEKNNNCEGTLQSPSKPISYDAKTSQGEATSTEWQKFDLCGGHASHTAFIAITQGHFCHSLFRKIQHATGKSTVLTALTPSIGLIAIMVMKICLVVARVKRTLTGASLSTFSLVYFFRENI
jgi:hypothetical protein